MNTSTKNLQAAAAFWAAQAERIDTGTTYVVATNTARRVLANNMAVMLSGACKPEEFSSHSTAITHAASLNGKEWDFDGAEWFQVMTYRGFCLLLAQRFTSAVDASRLADAFTHQNAAVA